MSLEKDVSTFLMENETSPKPSKAWPFQGNIKYIFCMIMNWFIMIGLFVCIINRTYRTKFIVYFPIRSEVLFPYYIRANYSSSN